MEVLGENSLPPLISWYLFPLILENIQLNPMRCCSKPKWELVRAAITLLVTEIPAYFFGKCHMPPRIFEHLEMNQEQWELV